MRIYIVIPAHNEEAFLARTLDSLIGQSLDAAQIVVVNDQSTDRTEAILQNYSKEYPSIAYINNVSSSNHEPGGKVVAAFNAGLKQLDDRYDLICKFDADLEFPPNYLAQITNHFENNPKLGMAGGFCDIEKEGKWVEEGLTNPDHIRGALKCYRKQCFSDIGGLKESMGWDTVDELLAKYHGWDVLTDTSLRVKHLKPTGARYSKMAGLKQGGAFRRMRYGFWLTLIATAKLALKKQSFSYFFDCIRGYFKNGRKYIVSSDEGRAIRRIRWRGVKKKLYF